MTSHDQLGHCYIKPATAHCYITYVSESSVFLICLYRSLINIKVTTGQEGLQGLGISNVSTHLERPAPQAHSEGCWNCQGQYLTITHKMFPFRLLRSEPGTPTISIPALDNVVPKADSDA